MKFENNIRLQDIIETKNIDTTNVFQWGSNDLSYWLIRTNKNLWVTEHSKYRFFSIKDEVETRKLKNVTLDYTPISKDTNSEFGEYTDFCNNIKKYPTKCFNLITIDNNETSIECFKLAIPHLVIGGYIAVMNSSFIPNIVNEFSNLFLEYERVPYKDSAIFRIC